VRHPGAWTERRHVIWPLAAYQQQRTHAVERDLPGGLRTELIVEDFKGQRSLVAGDIDRLHEIPDGEISLSGEATEVPAPGEDIEVELRGVRKLNQENPIRGNRRDRRGGKTGRKRMEAVQNDSDRGMVGAPHDLPGIPIVVDIASPRQRLEPDP